MSKRRLKYESVFHPSALVLLSPSIIKLLSIVKLLWQVSLLWKHSHYRESLNYISPLYVNKLVLSFPQYGREVLTVQAAVRKDPDLLFSLDSQQTPSLSCPHHPTLPYCSWRILQRFKPEYQFLMKFRHVNSLNKGKQSS